jgi:hypothetical protein
MSLRLAIDLFNKHTECSFIDILKKREASQNNPEAKIPWQLTSPAQGLFLVDLVNQELQMNTKF